MIASHLRKNDANYCRLKGWPVGTVFSQERLCDVAGIHYFKWTYRITAIGEASILVRQRYENGKERPEEQWSRSLLEYPVVDVTLPEEAGTCTKNRNPQTAAGPHEGG